VFGKGFGFYNWKRIPEGLNPLPLARGRDRVGLSFTTANFQRSTTPVAHKPR